MRVERTDDGGRCLVFEAEFSRRGERAIWDWAGRLDLSGAGYVAFDAMWSEPWLVRLVGVYFGTTGGWHARFLKSFPGAWATYTLRLDRFSTEGEPGGWENITAFRFSFWSEGAGRVVVRLREMRLLPPDPEENFVINGSFEILSGGTPYGWGSGHWGLGRLPWAIDPGL
ncbi:MAG TPA: hypothetical protein EYP90_14420 [Chromatiaceae bacterium]|nr:hypothetical protein [Chromatiaceae bacterium]